MTSARAAMAALAASPVSWIPIVVAAAATQTIRNAAQRSLTKSAGTLGATLVRFLYGLPFASLWLVLVIALGVGTLPYLDAAYFAWLLLGAIGQLLATAFLLLAMAEKNFVVAVAYSKTEILQIAGFSVLVLSEAVGGVALAAMVAATIGVVLVSAPKGEEASNLSSWFSRAAAYGVVSGTFFALCAVGYRAAALHFAGQSPVLMGALNLVWAQSIQSVLLAAWLAVRNRAALGAVARQWRISLLAGFTGAVASIGWLTAMAMHSAADVRTLGLIEVVFSYALARRVFRERLRRVEAAGLVLLTIGLALICLQLRKH